MINICIHGHFYQPPRENPWTGEIERQESASPFHDWNERIYTECYKPNAEAPIMDEKGMIISLVNNYEYINFNFGPTLLSWIKNKHYDTYLKIIEADKESVRIHNGHGNAIAMAYNHMILPLANERDKVTQIRWGLKEFKYDFKRNAESLWLPETACNTATVEVLINEGMKYIILDSGQAEKIRKIGSEEWMDISNNSLDPQKPYRCYSEKDNSKYIDIFFYDGPISRSISFESVLISSNDLLKRILNSVPQNPSGDILISTATDGETFGHHKKFAERTIAYFVTRLAFENKLRVVNFAEYLEHHIPHDEVKIKPGKNNEGTSWSCPHGVDRWKDDCGCGGGGGWHQRWRKPLRETMNWLRDELAKIYEEKGGELFKDVWTARNDYVDLLLDASDKARIKFFNDNAKRILTQYEVELSLELLEMQKFAMFIFASCGWFFSDISGIEAVQNLACAARAMQIAKEVSGISLEDEFLERISLAESNIKLYKNGRGVYEKLVKPRMTLKT